MTTASFAGRRRILIVVVLLVLALLSALLVAMTGGDDATDLARQVTATQDEEQGGGDGGDMAEGDAADLGDLPVQTYQVFLARDPFSPLTPPEGGANGGSGGGDGTNGGDGTDGNGGDGTTTTAILSSISTQDVFVNDQGETRAILEIDGTMFTVGVGDVLTSAVRISTNGSESFADLTVSAISDPCVTASIAGESMVYCVGEAPSDGDGEQTVALVDVFVDEETGEERALIQVDSTLYEVGEGQEFAENFRVLSIDPPCVTLLRGDEALTLCEGDQVLK